MRLSFRPISAMSTEDVRKFLRSRDPEGYNLVDVRQPKEYERGHIAGAQLIPVADLVDRIGSIDPTKPTITY